MIIQIECEVVTMGLILTSSISTWNNTLMQLSYNNTRLCYIDN